VSRSDKCIHNKIDVLRGSEFDLADMRSVIAKRETLASQASLLLAIPFAFFFVSSQTQSKFTKVVLYLY